MNFIKTIVDTLSGLFNKASTNNDPVNKPQPTTTPVIKSPSTYLPTLISVDQFRLFAPTSDYEYVAPALNKAANKYGILSDRQIRHWLAHLDVESAHFQHYEENLVYTAQRLCQVWPKRFPTIHDAQAYARQPKLLANKVYGGRLGNTAPDDGWNYRGRGYIQLTGKENYQKASIGTGLNLIDYPDLLTHNDAAADVAGWYWKTHGLNAIVAIDPDEKKIIDILQSVKINEEDDLLQGTKSINGGLIGIEDRRYSLYKAAGIWKY